jgi:RNA polymerase sigma-70 factor (ECF subfamily)
MIDDEDLNAWFVGEVLRLEVELTAYLRRNWRTREDVFELRQDIYEKTLVGARRGLPTNTRAYVFTVARNHLINTAKRAQVVPIEMIADLDLIDHHIDLFAAERVLAARDELRWAKDGVDKLPPKCREIVILRKVEGLTDREAAEALGVSVETVRRQIKLGMKALIDHMLGGSGKIVRKAYPRGSSRKNAPRRDI